MTEKPFSLLPPELTTRRRHYLSASKFSANGSGCGMVLLKLWILALSLGVGLLGAQAATAQPASDDDAKAQQTEHNWAEMMHYTLIGNWDEARGFGELLLSADPDPILLLNLAEDDRYADHYRNLALMKANTPLAEVAEGILQLVEEGRFHRRTDRRRIEMEVKRLSGSTRGRMMALERLKDSGEWAVPVIIEALRDTTRGGELAVIRRALREMGKPAVNPLVVALQQCDELNIKLIVLDALGRIGYGSAAPYIRQIIETETPGAKLYDAALEAIDRIDKQGQTRNLTAAALFEQLAQDYYTHLSSLAVPADQEYANIWSWDNQKGLVYERVKCGAFDELMAMRCCEQALRIDANRSEAISLWLSAFFRFESEGFSQPGYFGDNHADAATYALTAGPEYLHRVLQRALQDRNRPVALAAIEALQRNSGQQSLLYNLESQQPLIAALSYPDRQVRFSAALSIGGALPRDDFEYSEVVAPILAEALRQKGQRYAVVVDENDGRRNELVAQIRELGEFAEVVSGTHFAVALEQARRIPSFDLMVLSADIQQPNAGQAVEIMKKNYRLAFCPTIIISPVETVAQARNLREASTFVEVLLEDATLAEIIAAAAEILVRNQARPFEQDLADYYAAQAAEVLRRLALAINTVVDPKDALTALIEAISDQRRGIQQDAAETLARIDSLEAQRTIARLALDESVELDIRLMAFRNLAVSAKAYGNLLLAEQIDAIYTDLVSSLEVDPELRNLAAEAYGSLNLPSARISQLIKDQSKIGER